MKSYSLKSCRKGPLIYHCHMHDYMSSTKRIQNIKIRYCTMWIHNEHGIKSVYLPLLGVGINLYSNIGIGIAWLSHQQKTITKLWN